MAEISIIFVVGGAPKTATVSAKLRDVTGTYAIKNAITGAVIVTPTSALTPIATGTYEYDISALVPGTYTAMWEFIDAEAGAVYVPAIFTVDQAISVPRGVTLAEIEQQVARLTGPYARERVTSDLSTVSVAILGRLKSRLTSGQYEDLFLLRRGVLQDGTAVPGFDDDDRVRMISGYEPTLGSVEVDRDWTVVPVENEMMEIMHLNPEDIRFAVQEGLKRCFFLDLVSVATSSATAQRDLSAALPWLQNPEWIYGAEWNYPGSTTTLPGSLYWWEPIREGNTVQFRASGDPYPNTLKLRVARPYATYVNGVTSVITPNDDNDIVPGPVDYCAKAAHVECWRYFPDRMLAAAEEGYRIGRKEAVEAFEAASYDVFRAFPQRQQQPIDPYGWISALSSVRVN